MSSELNLERVLREHYDPTTCVRDHGMPGDVPMVEAHAAHVAAILRKEIMAWVKSPDMQDLLASTLTPVMRAWGVKSGHGEWTDAETCGHAGAEGAAKVRAELAAQIRGVQDD